jgi:hypothetical protein
MPSAEMNDPTRTEWKEPKLFCGNPHCFSPASHVTIFGEQLAYSCDDHYGILVWSFPSSTMRSRTLTAGEDVPEGMDPIVQSKRYLKGGPPVLRIVGARKT